MVYPIRLAVKDNRVDRFFQIATRLLRPITPGSPISAVRVGPPDDIAVRSRQLARAMRVWGILQRFLVSS